MKDGCEKTNYDIFIAQNLNICVKLIKSHDFSYLTRDIPPGRDWSMDSRFR
jgi:hypothetical protein